MDWLAGSRLHLVDVVATRGFTFLPIYLLGFERGRSSPTWRFVSLHAVFIHANVRRRFGWLEQLLVTPHFHHWHHAAESGRGGQELRRALPVARPAVRQLFAPARRWPDEYGVSSDGESDRVPDGYGRRSSSFRSGGPGLLPQGESPGSRSSS